MAEKSIHLATNCADCNSTLTIVRKRSRRWCETCHQAWTPCCAVCGLFLRLCECGDRKVCALQPEDVWQCGNCGGWNGYQRKVCKNCDAQWPEWVERRLQPFGYGERISQQFRMCPVCVSGYLNGYGANVACTVCKRRWIRQCPLCQHQRGRCKCGTFQTLRWNPILLDEKLLQPEVVPCKCGRWVMVGKHCRFCANRHESP